MLRGIFTAVIAGSALLALGGAARAHGGQPTVTGLSFPMLAPGEVWALTDTQGLFIRRVDGAVEWLCEDALEVDGELRLALLLGAADAPRLLVSTDAGLYQSDDRGCTWSRMAGALGERRARAGTVHPLRPGEALVATDAFGRRNDVFRTEDSGRTWRGAGLDLPTQILQLLRAEADPERVYLRFELGGRRSRDGGQTFEAMTLGPQELDVSPLEWVLLGVDPVEPDVVFAAVERFPDTLILRSEDAGDTWSLVAAVDDFPLQLVQFPDGEAVVHAPFAGLWRSLDGGRTWAPEPAPVPLLRTLARSGDRLWGGTQIYFGGPWALGSSDDRGRTWAVALADFTAARRLPCDPMERGVRCCAAFCPGLPPGGVCPDWRAEAVACDPPGGRDGGPGDAGLGDSGQEDAGQEDAGPPDVGTPDAGPPDAGLRDAGLADAGRGDAGQDGDAPLDRGTPLDRGAGDVAVDAEDATPLEDAAAPREGGATRLDGTADAADEDAPNAPDAHGEPDAHVSRAPDAAHPLVDSGSGAHGRDGGCACDASGRDAPGASWWLLLVLARARRRALLTPGRSRDGACSR